MPIIVAFVLKKMTKVFRNVAFVLMFTIFFGTNAPKVLKKMTKVFRNVAFVLMFAIFFGTNAVKFLKKMAYTPPLCLMSAGNGSN